jgi:hypothetical protein
MFWDPQTYLCYLEWEEMPEQWKECINEPVYEEVNKID